MMLATVSVLGCLLLSGCDGKDGDPGLKGPDGVDGPPGGPGKDGDGVQESLSYGNIVVSFAGKLPDGKDFADTIRFRYAPLGVDGFEQGSQARIFDNHYEFYIYRFYSTVDAEPGLQDNFVRLVLDVTPTEGGAIIFPLQCSIHTYMKTSPTKLAVVQQDFAGVVSVDDFEDYRYTPATGDLSFRLNIEESQQQTSVGISELKMTLVADLKVFQQIITEDGP
jgi:hypothetical protein